MHNVTEALADLFPDILPNTDDKAWRSHLRNLFIQLDIAIIHGCYQFLFCGWIRHRTINLVAKVQKNTIRKCYRFRFGEAVHYE